MRLKNDVSLQIGRKVFILPHLAIDILTLLYRLAG
jgi:hypothetical protein